MSTTRLTQAAAQALIGEIFVYHMPFNQTLGLQLQHHTVDYAELVFAQQDKLVGNAHQRILHGGVIASVLDVCAGLICVGSVLLRDDEIIQENLLRRLTHMGTIDIRVDYLRPGRGEQFIASGHLLRAGNKVAVARVELHNEKKLHIASAIATYLIG